MESQEGLTPSPLRMMFIRLGLTELHHMHLALLLRQLLLDTNCKKGLEGTNQIYHCREGVVHQHKLLPERAQELP